MNNYRLRWEAVLHPLPSLRSNEFEQAFESGNALVTRPPAFGCKAMQTGTHGKREHKGGQCRDLCAFMQTYANLPYPPNSPSQGGDYGFESR